MPHILGPCDFKKIEPDLSDFRRRDAARFFWFGRRFFHVTQRKNPACEAEVRYLKGDKELAETKHVAAINLLNAKLEAMQVVLAGKGEQIKGLTDQVRTNEGRERVLQKKLEAAEESRNKAEAKALRGTPTKGARGEEGIEAGEIGRLRQHINTLKEVKELLVRNLTSLSMCTEMLSGDGTGVPAAPTPQQAKLACKAVAEAKAAMQEADTMSKESDSQ